MFALSIVDQDSPESRMVEVVRWYLSAYHAGRNADVAKKPYNPILGEVFKCYYKLPTNDANVSTSDS